MKSYRRTPIEKKYLAVKMLQANCRTFRDGFVPRIRQVARELDLTPQNVKLLWDNREDILKRSETKIPESKRKEIDKKVKKQLDNKVESWLQQSKRKDYNEVPVKELIKSFGELTDMIEAKAGL
jgi:hypothetical protein